MQTNSTSANQPPKTISVGAVLSEAWQRVSGFKWSVFKRVILNLVCVIPLWLIYIYYIFSQPKHGVSSYVMVLILMGVVQWITIKIWIPVYLMAVRKAIDMPISLESIKTECARVAGTLTSFIILYVLMIDAIELIQFIIHATDTIGFVTSLLLRLVADIIVIFLGAFVLPLIVIRRLSLMQALDKASAKVLQYWKVVLTSYGFLLIIPLIYRYINLHLSMKGSAAGSLMWLYAAINLLFLVASFWLMPLYFTIGGVLFREVYGLKKQ